jgi:AraC-like DNA-binding protein
MTPTEFIRSVRIKRAAQLLENENILINEVSDLVGFNDPKYFSRCFSKEKGVSPSQYRSFSLKKSTSSD